MTFFQTYQTELLATLFILVFLIIIRAISKKLIYKLGKRTGINDARIHLISRYATVTLILIALLIETFIFGAQLKDLALVFSSVFAVIGIALFAIWSILTKIPFVVSSSFPFHNNEGIKFKFTNKIF